MELLTGTDAPDDVLEAFLSMAKASGELHKSSIAGIDAALLVMQRRAAVAQVA